MKNYFTVYDLNCYAKGSGISRLPLLAFTCAANRTVSSISITTITANTITYGAIRTTITANRIAYGSIMTASPVVAMMTSMSSAMSKCLGVSSNYKT